MPFVASTTCSVPDDSAVAWIALACVIGLVCTRVVYAVYCAAEPSACSPSCASTKLTATAPSVNRPEVSSAAPWPSVNVKLTVAAPPANPSLVTWMSTPGCVSHGAGAAGSPGVPASPGAPGPPSAPGVPGSPGGPGGPSHAP